jgi:hypothetical protein
MAKAFLAMLRCLDGFRRLLRVDVRKVLLFAVN